MSKRFVDTELWDRPWFRKLPSHYRELWGYILSKCDSAGVWYVDLEHASFLIGYDFQYSETLKIFSKQISRLRDESRWFVKDFVRFQHGELKDTNNFHRSIIKKLEELDFYDDEVEESATTTNAVSGPELKNAGPEKIFSGAIVKDTVTVKEQVKDVVKRFAPPTLQEVQEYCNQLVAVGKNKVDPEAWMDYYLSKGWKIGSSPMKDWKAAVRTWEKNDYGSHQQRSGSAQGRVVGAAAPTPNKFDSVDGR